MTESNHGLDTFAYVPDVLARAGIILPFPIIDQKTNCITDQALKTLGSKNIGRLLELAAKVGKGFNPDKEITKFAQRIHQTGLMVQASLAEATLLNPNLPVADLPPKEPKHFARRNQLKAQKHLNRLIHGRGLTAGEKLEAEQRLRRTILVGVGRYRH